MKSSTAKATVTLRARRQQTGTHPGCHIISGCLMAGENDVPGLGGRSRRRRAGRSRTLWTAAAPARELCDANVEVFKSSQCCSHGALIAALEHGAGFVTLVSWEDGLAMATGSGLDLERAPSAPTTRRAWMVCPSSSSTAASRPTSPTFQWTIAFAWIPSRRCAHAHARAVLSTPVMVLSTCTQQ